MDFNTFPVQTLAEESSTITLQRLAEFAADLSEDDFDHQESSATSITSDVCSSFCETEDCECFLIDVDNEFRSFNSTHSLESSITTPWRLHGEFIKQLKIQGDEAATAMTFCHLLCHTSNNPYSDMGYTDWEEGLERASTPHPKMWSETLDKDNMALMMLMGHRVTEFVNCF